uniref:Predicted DNA-directed RNA polymerases I and III subunit rpac1-like n=1 Tax=Malus domestica TaxID=3750 RepID=A0A4Y1QC96_MALDO|nr:predicted DNA-directed RNA polymerases I and III subunit rpac1-like [Malus domestica]
MPPNIEFQRTHVECKADAPIHTDTFRYNGAYASMGVDNNLLDSFCDNFKVEVINLTEDEMEFDMISIDPALANAFRRILIAEMEVCNYFSYFLGLRLNTSVIQDEVLAHRLGLIPIKVDPRLFEFTNNTPNEKNTIVFKLHVQCKRGGTAYFRYGSVQGRIHSGVVGVARPLGNHGNNLEAPIRDLLELGSSGSESHASLGINGLSGELPKELGNLTDLISAFGANNFSGPLPSELGSLSKLKEQDSLPEFSDNPIDPTSGDIIIARLGPGQVIELEAHAVKGIGKTHAKWSPVAPVWYRMLPEVKIFDIEDIGNKKRATVARPRACTLCRECIGEGKGWENSISAA